MDPRVAGRTARLLEPLHSLGYFAPEVEAALVAIGLRAGRMTYFASRAAPMGKVGGGTVTATFYVFNPSLVHHFVPACWDAASPESATAARYRGVSAAYERLLGADTLGSPEVAEAADLARTATEGCEPVGRPLFAGHAGLPWPEEPHLALWHAATLIREHRGDGHIAVLTSEGLSGLEANVLISAEGQIPRPVLQPSRDWTDEQWAAAEQRLERSGHLWDGGQLSTQGLDLRTRIEARTDRLAVEPWRHLGGEGSDRLRELARPLARAIVDAGAFPVPNAVGAADPN